jgi:hypothetical protein
VANRVLRWLVSWAKVGLYFVIALALVGLLLLPWDADATPLEEPLQARAASRAVPADAQTLVLYPSRAGLKLVLKKPWGGRTGLDEVSISGPILKRPRRGVAFGLKVELRF